MSDPRDSLHRQSVTADGGAGADGDPKHRAHDHLLDQFLAKVDRSVFVIVVLDQFLHLITFILTKYNLRLVCQHMFDDLVGFLFV